MRAIVVDVKIRGPKGAALLKALVDTGFYGDIMTYLWVAKDVGVELRYRRKRRLPNGRIIDVMYGVCEIELEGQVTGGDMEVWDELNLPGDVNALLGMTALEKLGFKVDSKTGKLEKTELYLL